LGCFSGDVVFFALANPVGCP